MLTETDLEVILAIPMPSYELLNRGDETCRENLYAVLDELTDSDAIPLGVGTNRVSPVFELLDDAAKKTVSEFGVFADDDFDQCEFLKVSTTIPLSGYADCHNTEYDTETNAGLSAVVARVEFCKRISDLLVFANIARLGSIELRSSAVTQNGELLEFSEVPQMDGFAAQCALAIADKMQWPPLSNLTVKQVLEWSRISHETIDGFDGSSMSRALAAFSRLFEKKNVDEPMQLLWALVGIESIYVRGKAELFQQVKEKSQVLLGPQEAYKKVLSRMYDFRSRFVHGDLGFPSLSLLYDARPEVNKYDEGLSEATSVAVCVLAATIQETIQRGWDGVHFSYTAHPPNTAK